MRSKVAGYPRLFLAIPLSGETRTYFQELGAQLQPLFSRNRVKWTAPENLHLTLHYFGKVSVEEYAVIEAIADRVLSTCPRFVLSFDKAVVFPSLDRPRLIACEIETNKTLESLVADLRLELTQAGQPTATRPFRGHVTLGRFRDLPTSRRRGENARGPRQHMAAIEERLPRKTGPAMSVGDVVLCNSATGIDGAVYEVVKHWRLGALSSP